MNIRNITYFVCIGLIFSLSACDDGTQAVTAKKMFKENTANPFAPKAKNEQPSSATESSTETRKEGK